MKTSTKVLIGLSLVTVSVLIARVIVKKQKCAHTKIGATIHGEPTCNSRK